jgi:hypothetical protein
MFNWLWFYVFQDIKYVGQQEPEFYTEQIVEPVLHPRIKVAVHYLSNCPCQPKQSRRSERLLQRNWPCETSVIQGLKSIQQEEKNYWNTERNGYWNWRFKDFWHRRKNSVISFNIEGIHPYDINHNWQIRNTNRPSLCTTHHDFFNIPGTIRASFAFYNKRNWCYGKAIKKKRNSCCLKI